MSGPIRTAVSVVLLAVLAGAPVAAAICADWCAPSNHAGHAQPHRGAFPSVHGPATASGSSAADCHGKSSGFQPRLTADVQPQCADYVLSRSEASPVAPRLQLALLVSTSPPGTALHADVALRVDRSPFRLAPASPPVPLAAPPVLRI